MDSTPCLTPRSPGLAMSHTGSARAIVHNFEGEPDWATLFLGAEADIQFQQFLVAL